MTNLKTRTAHTISAVIRECGMDRYEIAAAMSALLDEEVPKSMLDAYSAESRDDQNIPFYRLLAFIVATKSYRAFDEIVRPFGMRVLVGEQTRLAAIAHLEIERAQIDRRIKAMRDQLKARRS